MGSTRADEFRSRGRSMGATMPAPLQITPAVPAAADILPDRLEETVEDMARRISQVPLTTSMAMSTSSPGRRP